MQLDQRLQSILILIRVRSHPTSEAIFTICLLLIHQPTHHPSYSIPFTIILPATATATATAELHSMDSLSFTQTNHPPPRLGEYLVPGIQDFIHSRSPSFLPIDHPTIVVLHPIPVQSVKREYCSTHHHTIQATGNTFQAPNPMESIPRSIKYLIQGGGGVNLWIHNPIPTDTSTRQSWRNRINNLVEEMFDRVL